MKLSSILGQGRGKLGAAVFSSTNGQQVVRQYQPNVKNPNTVAQTMQRARFKLMTQIASSMAPVITIPKSGAVSSRNMFVKKNMPLVIGTVTPRVGVWIETSVLQQKSSCDCCFLCKISVFLQSITTIG